MKVITAKKTRCSESSMNDSALSHDFIIIDDYHAIADDGSIWQVLGQYEEGCTLTYESEDGIVFNYAEEGDFEFDFFDAPEEYDQVENDDEFIDFASEIEPDAIFKLLENTESWKDFYDHLHLAYSQREGFGVIRILEEEEVEIHEPESDYDWWQVTYNGKEPDAWDDEEVTESNYYPDNDSYKRLGACFKTLTPQVGAMEAAAFCGYEVCYKDEYSNLYFWYGNKQS